MSTPTGTTGAEDLLGRYCNHLDLPPIVRSVCSDIIVKARELGIADGRSPVSIAGGAIYFTCCLLDKPKSVREISAVAGVSEGTIKLVYRLYYAEKEKLVKEEGQENQGDAGETEEPVLPPPYETRDSIDFKLTLLEMYNQRVEKRLEAKAIMFDRNLTEYKKVSFLPAMRMNELVYSR